MTKNFSLSEYHDFFYFLRSINKVTGMVDLSEGLPNMEFGETVCFKNGYVT